MDDPHAHFCSVCAGWAGNFLDWLEYGHHRDCPNHPLRVGEGLWDLEAEKRKLQPDEGP